MSDKPVCPDCGRKTTVSMGFFAATGEDAWYCPHCNKIQPIPDRHQRQWTTCPYCGGEMIIDSNCENCEIMNDDRLIPDYEPYFPDDIEQAINEGLDAWDDRLTRQDYDDLLDNLADWNDDEPHDAAGGEIGNT